MSLSHLIALEWKRYVQNYEAKNKPPMSTLYHIENLIIGSQNSIYKSFLPLYTLSCKSAHNSI